MTPTLPTALLKALVPRAERDEILADLTAEYAARTAADGRSAAGKWFWRQALGSALPLLGWSGRREVTGYIPPANAYRPGGPMLPVFLSDARFALRRLRSRPAYAILSVLTLALGVGGTAAIFGIARPVLLDALPYANADRAGMFWMDGAWNEEEFSYLRDKFDGFAQVAGWRPGDVTLKQGDAPLRLIPGIATTGELFDVLGAHAFVGRTLRVGDDMIGAPPVAVVSYGLAEELGGSDVSSTVGKRLTLNGIERTVVGVMPKGFWYPTPAARIWTPQEIHPDRRTGYLTLVGLAKPGADLHNMGPYLARIVQTMAARFHYAGQWDKTRNPTVTPLRENLLGSMRPAVLAMLAAMALILLIACVNVAALMLGQIEGRSSEMAVRTALGATRTRLTQQIIVEALMIGVCAAIVGGALAAAGFGLLAHALPIGAWGESAQFDWTLFAVALAVAIGASLLVVLAPTISLWRGDVHGAISRARTGGIVGRGSRLEQGLVVTEVALAMLIASGSALLVRSVMNLYALNPGVDTGSIAVIDALAGNGTPAETGKSVEAIVTELSQLPGVTSAAAAMKIPLTGRGNSMGLRIAGRPDIEDVTTYFRVGTVDYLPTMGARIPKGRNFTTADKVAGPDVAVIINEAMARRFFPEDDPIGKVLEGGWGVKERIIGVAQDVAEGQLTDAPSLTRYYLAGAVPWIVPSATLVVRTNAGTDPAAILESARRAVQRAAPSFAVSRTTTMARIMDDAVGPARQIMSLLSLLAGLALVLGAIGIYGVIAHFASRRKRDWAIRVALGLSGGQVVAQVMKQGVVLTALGILFGIAGTMVLSRLLTTLLYGVRAVDPIAFAAASLVLLAIGAGAAFVPARRAGMTDPALVLREQ
jgi:putative ABC transport system permease protein